MRTKVNEQTLAILLEASINPNSTAYNICQLLTINIKEDFKTYERAIYKIASENLLLHSNFEIDDGYYIKPLILKPLVRDVLFTNEKEMHSLIRNQIKPFKLFSHEPLWRCTFIETKNNKHILLQFHHSIMDGQSITFFFDEMKEYIETGLLSKINNDFTSLIPFIQNKTIVGDLNPTNVENFSGNYNDSSFQSSLEFFLDKNVIYNCKTYAASNGVTLYILLLSSFCILLSRYSRQSDFTITTPVLGENAFDERKTLGMFVRNVLLKIICNDNDTIRDFIKRVDSTYSDIFTVGPIQNNNSDRDSICGALYRVMFAMIDLNTKMSINKQEIGISDIDTIDAQNHLMWYLFQEPDTFKIKINYALKHFDCKFITRMYHNWVSIINQILASTTGCIISKLSTTCYNEQNVILNTFNKKIPINNKSLYNLISKKSTIDELAITEIKKNGIKYFTYRDLFNKSNEFSAKLTAYTSYSCIIIYYSPGFESIALSLACMKNMIPFMFVSDETNLHLLKDINNAIPNSIIITNQSKNDVVGVHTINDLPPATNHSESLRGDDVLLYLSTSGTTGTPKIFPFTNIGFINQSYNMNNIYNTSSKSRVLIHASMNFDMYSISCFPPLIVGASIWIVDSEIRRDISHLSSLINSNSIDSLFLTTNLGQLFIKQFDNSSLKTLCLAGEKMNYWKKTNYDIYNLYGPAETGVVTSYKIQKQLSNIPIGKPLDNCQIVIVDNNLHLCPIGVVGEILIGGHQISKGYVNASKFNDNFLTVNFNDGLFYKSGDLGKFQDDGNILFYGRNDDQIKIDGQRIEIRGIENIIYNNFPFIKQCVVKAFADTNANYVLYLYITSNIQINVNKMHEQMLKLMPKYMVPNNIKQITGFTLTQSGKIDVKSLEKFDIDHIQKHNQIIKGIIPKKLAKLYASVLNIPINALSLDADFFKIGGNSIKSMELCFQINKVFNCNINNHTIYSHPRFFEQVNIIKEHRNKPFQLIHIDDQNSTKPICIVIHTANSSIENYWQFLHYDNPKYKFIFIDNYNLLSGNKRIDSIEKIASFYIKELNKARIFPPYSLCGWSYGGVIAFEMARQLSEVGETIDDLFIIDSMLLINDLERKKIAMHRDSYELVKYINDDPFFNDIKRKILKNKLLHNSKATLNDLIKYTPGRYHKDITLFKSAWDENIQQLTYNNFENFVPLEKIHIVNIRTPHDNLLSGISLKIISQYINTNEN